MNFRHHRGFVGGQGFDSWAHFRRCRLNSFLQALQLSLQGCIVLIAIPLGGLNFSEHLADGIQLGGADAVLAASIFHYGEFTVQQAKALLARDGIAVRL